MGFSTYSDTPYRMASCAYSKSSQPEKRTILICIMFSCRILATSNPSRNGILMSLITKSGRSVSVCSRSSFPFSAVAMTRNPSVSHSTESRIPSKICGSSSANITVKHKIFPSRSPYFFKKTLHIRQYRTKSVWRLCTPSACKFPFRACFVSSRTHLACIFSEIFRENTRKSTKDFLRFSLHLSKNLTTQSAYVRYETDSHISQKCS